MQLAAWLQQATKALGAVADQPRMEARRLVERVCKWDAVEQIANPENPLSPEQLQQLSAFVQRRLAHEPLSRIIGKREFWGLNLSISGATLDPRADTETLVELVLETCAETPPSRILDLGTGSGAILLALLSEYPAATGLGIDQNRETLQTARTNAQALGLSARARFEHGNWLEGLTGRFDLIVSNPPYIPTAELATLAPNVRKFDDPAALDGGADGLSFYRLTLQGAAGRLNSGGVLALELGVDQSTLVGNLAQTCGWSVVRSKADLAGIPRALTLVAS